MAHENEINIIVEEELLNIGFWSPLASGEANSGVNVGGGAEIFRDKTGEALNLRTLTEGLGIAITENADDIEIATTTPSLSGLAGYDEITTPVVTTSAVLEDITGLSFDLTLDRPGRILALMSTETSISGGAPSSGGWAISIAGVDGNEITRYISGSSDMGSVIVQSAALALGAGTHTIKGRHRRVSGGSTISTNVAQLSAVAYLD